MKEWVLRLKPDADFTLQIAALAHDIERAFVERKVKRSEYKDYNDFKKAHAANSTRMVSEILDKYPVSEDTKNKIAYLVEQHAGICVSVCAQLIGDGSSWNDSKC